ncbi:NRDE family protein [Rubrivirga sp. IMCC45206]|uniref:NRDE family protein n=1 Tax=Rubrivirga sp. IMCC45206 TaxID=3391614 RepID=UPI0039902AE0
MCLIAFALDAHPAHRLVLMANRDEAFARPAAPLAPWPDAPGVLAGRDLTAGGTWLGVAPGGRWAALTNVRDPLLPCPAQQSRGRLVADFLRRADPAARVAEAVRQQRDAFDGFNLVVGDPDGVFVVSTRHDDVLELGAGVYGLSNDRLDTPWPKVVRARRRLRDAVRAERLDPEDLLALLDDREGAPDAKLPDTGVGLALERVLAPVRIVSDGYGTRVSTALVLDRNGTGTITERTWRADGSRGDTVSESVVG